MTSQWAIGIAVVMGIAGLPAPAEASIKEYQIARLLNFKTECQMDKLEDRSPPTGPAKFFASCLNVTFYSDGILLECPDRDDEWTCRLLTQPKTFGSLDLLRQKQSK